MRLDDLEFRHIEGERPSVVRWKEYGLTSTRPINAPEAKEFCYTVLMWERSREGYDIKFVGDRPFNCDMADLWGLMQYGQAVLDAKFKLEQR